MEYTEYAGMVYCDICLNRNAEITPMYAGGPTGPCRKYKKVPRDVFFKGKECKHFDNIPGKEMEYSYSDEYQPLT